MCVDPVTAGFIGMSVLSAGSQIAGGQAANAGAKLEARQYEVRRSQAETEADFMVRERFREFQQVKAQNDAVIAVSGLAASSFDALLDNNEQVARDDMAIIARGGKARAGEMSTAAAATRARGSAARTQAFIGAGTTLANAAFVYQMNRIPSGSSPVSGGGSLVKLSSKNKGV